MIHTFNNEIKNQIGYETDSKLQYFLGKRYSTLASVYLIYCILWIFES